MRHEPINRWHILHGSRTKLMDWPSGSIEHIILRDLGELGFQQPARRNRVKLVRIRFHGPLDTSVEQTAAV
jgi:hypothetical protein